MNICIGCLEPCDGPTCGAGACIRIWRFAEREAGRPDPLQGAANG